MLLYKAAKYIWLSWQIFLLNVSSAFSFRTSFFMRIFGAITFYVIEFMVWIIFFGQFTSVKGWTIDDMRLLYSVYFLSFGIMDSFLGGAFYIDELVVSSGLDFYLLLPKPPLWHIAVSKTDPVSLATIFLGIVFFLGSAKASFSNFFVFILVSALAAIILFSFNVIVRSITFFVGSFEKPASLAWFLLSDLLFYPASIFDGPYKVILMTVLPSFFAGTVPVEILREFNITSLFTLVLFSFGTLALAIFVFQAGLKKYESGSGITVRS